MTGDEGTVYDDAPLCLCCESALAKRLEDGRILVDPDLREPICVDCGYHLYRARVFLAMTADATGIRGCANLGPDSGMGVAS